MSPQLRCWSACRGPSCPAESSLRSCYQACSSSLGSAGDTGSKRRLQNKSSLSSSRFSWVAGKGSEGPRSILLWLLSWAFISPPGLPGRFGYSWLDPGLCCLFSTVSVLVTTISSPAFGPNIFPPPWLYRSLRCKVLAGLFLWLIEPRGPRGGCWLASVLCTAPTRADVW